MPDEESLTGPSPEGPTGSGSSAANSMGPAIPPELQSLEAALGSLRPATPRLDRDRLMFAAGQASVTPRSQSWSQTALRHVVPMAAAAAAAVLVAAWAWHPDPQIVERTVYLPALQQPIATTDKPRADASVVAPETPDSGPAPIASSAPDRRPALPTWLISWIGMEPKGGRRLPWRGALVEEHDDALWANSGVPCPPKSASPDSGDSRPAAPGPRESEPTMSRQSLDQLLNDFTVAPRLTPRFLIPESQPRTLNPNAAWRPQPKGSDVQNSILAEQGRSIWPGLPSAKIEFCTSEPRMCARRAHPTDEDSQA